MVTSHTNMSKLTAVAPTNGPGAQNLNTIASANARALEPSPLRPVSYFLMATVIVNDIALTRPCHKFALRS